MIESGNEPPTIARRRAEWPLGLVVACVIGMLYPMLGADFGIIDDHEIVTIIGRDNRVHTSEILPLVRQFALEDNGRFRPGYYVLRIFEAFVVGDSAGSWYANRLLLALISAVALYWGLRILLPPVYAGVVTLLFFSGPQNEIWTRLGPPEAYGVPMVLVGLSWITVRLGRRQWDAMGLFPGFVLLFLAGFIKESFIPILPAALVFVYGVVPLVIPSVAHDRRFQFQDAAMLVVLSFGLAVQAWLTMSMLLTYGHQRGVEVSIRSFVSWIGPVLVAYSKRALWFVPTAAGLAALLGSYRQESGSSASRHDLIRITIALVAGAILILLPQSVVYGGNDLEGRYLTPGNLFVIFAAAVGFYGLSRRPHAPFWPDKLRNVSRQTVGIFVASALLLAILYSLVRTHRDADAAALATSRFQSKLNEIVQLKRQHPELPVLFYSTDVFDREPLVSVASYLVVKLPQPERPFLQPYDWERGADSVLRKRLAQLLTAQSVEGDAYFSKFSDFVSRSGGCIAAIFSGTDDGGCEYRIQFHDF